MTGSSIAIGAAAAASSASARTVQITLANEQATGQTVGGNNTFTGDFTGDNLNDVPSLGGNFGSGNGIFFGALNSYTAGNAFAGTVASAGAVGVAIEAQVQLGNPVTLSSLIPFVFTDARINGGAATGAFFEVRVSNTATTATVRVLRTVFDDASITRPTGVVAGGTNTEFDPTVYAQRTKLANKVKKLKKKAKAASRAGNPIKAKKLNKKVKKLNKRLAAIS